MHFISSLDILRGLSAISIMILHMNKMVAQTESGTLGAWSELLSLGVDYFFVLSGFLMYYLHEKDVGNTMAIKRYALKRITRIYPMFWLSLALSLALIPLSKSMEFPPLQDIIKHVFLITPHIDENGAGRVLGVAWTLELEMMFYFAFAIWLLIRPSWGRTLWIFASLVLAMFHPYVILFLSGMLTAIWLKRFGPHLIKHPLTVMTLSFVCLIAVDIAEITLLQEKICQGICLFSLIISCVSAEAKYPQFFKKVPNVFYLSGKVSYTIYLMHIPIGLVLFSLMNKTFDLSVLPGFAWVALLCAMIFSICSVISLKVEHPINRWFQSKMRK